MVSASIAAEHNLTAKTANVLLSRREAAEFLGIEVQTLAAWATTGRYNLPYVLVGRLAKYRLSDLEQFVQSRTVLNSGEAGQLN